MSEAQHRRRNSYNQREEALNIMKHQLAQSFPPPHYPPQIYVPLPTPLYHTITLENVHTNIHTNIQQYQRFQNLISTKNKNIVSYKYSYNNNNSTFQYIYRICNIPHHRTHKIELKHHPQNQHLQSQHPIATKTEGNFSSSTNFPEISNWSQQKRKTPTLRRAQIACPENMRNEDILQCFFFVA